MIVKEHIRFERGDAKKILSLGKYRTFKIGDKIEVLKSVYHHQNQYGQSYYSFKWNDNNLSVHLSAQKGDILTYEYSQDYYWDSPKGSIDHDFIEKNLNDFKRL